MSGGKGVIENTFKEMTYNGISLTYDEQTGYVNISKAFRENNKQWNKYKLTKAWKEIEKYAENKLKNGDWKVVEKSPPPNNALYYDVNTGQNEYRGIYIHPKLTHFVCQYVSITYAFKVAELMDSINESVHNELKQKQLPDTPEQAKPIFEQHVEQIIHRDNELENKQCWGYRDSPYKLDSWEQMDMERDLKAYEKAKKALLEAKKVVDTWKGFIQDYFPTFEL